MVIGTGIRSMSLLQQQGNIHTFLLGDRMVEKTKSFMRGPAMISLPQRWALMIFLPCHGAWSLLEMLSVWPSMVVKLLYFSRYYSRFVLEDMEIFLDLLLAGATLRLE